MDPGVGPNHETTGGHGTSIVLVGVPPVRKTAMKFALAIWKVVGPN